MDYFYNSIEFNSRSKLSEKEKIELNDHIYSILELYNKYIENKEDILVSQIINQSYLLQIGFNLLITKRIFVNGQEQVYKRFSEPLQVNVNAAIGPLSEIKIEY